ncbi:MAG: sensor histidine kinase [Pisciglobus halotolerans]|nr:sensor histidine kinase [Pisciglobus halotolerans]
MKVKENQVYRLLKTFAAVLILIMTLFTLLVSYTLFRRNHEKAEQSMLFVSENLTALTQENWVSTKREADELTNDAQKIESMLQYFQLPPDDYLSKALEEAETPADLLYFPNEVERMYTGTPSLVSVALSLNNFDHAFSSSIKNKYGSKNKIEDDELIDGIRFSTNVQFPFTGEAFGTLHMTYEKESYRKIIQSENVNVPMEVFLLSDTNQLIYHGVNGKRDQTLKKNIQAQLLKHTAIDEEELKKSYLLDQQETENGYKILTVIPKQSILDTSAEQSSGLFLFSLLVDSLLVIVLFVLFRKYVRQVEDILVSSRAVSRGDSQNRISLENKSGEMKQIAGGINQMLDSMQVYLKDIYDLEIKQRDAQMGALQAQINPHFLYNTLEYIRMSAISEGAEELAEVVYSFGALLRNNISQEKMVTLESEMAFCEKYIYLYQMRYPDQVAYDFKLAKDVEQLLIPKFCIQPLVENYFAHGIDFVKIDNVISIKAYKEKKATVIKIIDNGLGMSQEKMDKINQAILEKKEPSEKSVGILNVYQRLYLTFGKDVSLYYSKTKQSGVTVTITILREGE